jgi:hypothetical protein
VQAQFFAVGPASIQTLGGTKTTVPPRAPMNTYLSVAAALGFLVGLAHSVLGETMVFSRMRQGLLVPTNGGSVLRQPHVRILWASWHVLTVFGWSLSAMLLLLASEPSAGSLRAALLQSVVAAMLLASVVVMYATKARHPGWLGLLGVAALTWLGIGH